MIAVNVKRGMESGENIAFYGALTLEYFKTCSSVGFKIFLSLRNRSVNGPLELLAAR